MKTKTKFRLTIITLGLIVLYLFMFFIGNQIVKQSQQRQLKQLGYHYQTEQLQTASDQGKHSWQQNFKLRVISLPTTKKGKLNQTAQNLIDRNLVNASDPFAKTNYQGETYWFYLISDRDSKKSLALLAQPQQTLLNRYGQIWLVFSSLYLLFFMAVALLYRRQQRKLHEKVAQLAANMKAMTEQQEPEPFLLKSGDALAPVADQFKELTQAADHQLLSAKLHRKSLRFLIDNLPLGVMLLNQEGQVEIANQALGTILAVEDDEQPKVTYLDYVKTYALSRLIEKVLRKPQVKQHQRQDIQLVGENGRFVEADVISLVVSEAQTQKMKVLVILYDLTDFKANEQNQLNFVTNAGHELRSPVATIANAAQQLLTHKQHDSLREQEEVTTIAKQARHLDALIRDILLLSDTNQGLQIKWQPVQFDQLVQTELHQAQAAIKARHLKVSLDVTAYQGPVLADEVKLQQIVRNLLSNAIAYNVEDGRIDIQLETNTTQTIFKIKDTGIGMTTTDQKRVFERFYRVDQAHTAAKGTGLGLAIVANLVAQLGGQVKVDSQLGVGSLFTVSLPKSRLEQKD